MRAQLIEINSYNKYIYGAIHFIKEKVDYHEILTPNFIKELNYLIQVEEIKSLKEQSLEVTSQDYPILSKYIESLYLCDYYPYEESLWWDGSLQSGIIQSSDSAINYIIEEKEKKSKIYERNFSQKWLLIYAAGLGLNDIFNNSGTNMHRQGPVFIRPLNKGKIENPISFQSNYFDYIFIWDKFSEKIFQICPYFKKIFDNGTKQIWVNHLPIK